jgi:hypothetical protein
MRRAIPLVLVLGAAGCAGEPTAVGSWQSSIVVVDQRNILAVNDAGGGDALLHVVFTENRQTVAGAFDFAVQWAETGREGAYSFDMRCEASPFGDAGCDPEDDFDMDCTLVADGEALDCRGDGRWEDYDFGWIRLASE